ncbi:MAG: hypothetical protein ABIG85_00480 [Chloroflexota bacterium]
MSWLRRAVVALAPRRAGGGEDSVPMPAEAEAEEGACSTCGRSDLPLVGDWDPPICQECDAAINFDSLGKAGSFDHR